MAGIYFHIPFCKQRCTYCDFHFSTSFESYRSAMIDVMHDELVQRLSELSTAIETVYFGGGTPSLLTERELIQLLQPVFERAQPIEVTLECNPDDMTMERLAMWKRIGINRLSIGLQSFKSTDLAWMNRAHTVAEAERCIQWAKDAGFHVLTVDLMYGLPRLSMEEWTNHLERVLDLGVRHISAYCLTVERKTALELMVKRGDLNSPDDEVIEKQFQRLLEVTEKYGLEHYEISNFAVPGFESKHNTNYWLGIPYVGVGPSAHSYDGETRRWNIANNAQYLKLFKAGERYWEQETLTAKEHFNERLLTGLRTKWGIELPVLESINPVNSDFKQTIEDWVEKGYMIHENQCIYLTKEGRLFADAIASSLFAE